MSLISTLLHVTSHTESCHSSDIAFIYRIDADVLRLQCSKIAMFQDCRLQHSLLWALFIGFLATLCLQSVCEGCSQEGQQAVIAHTAAELELRRIHCVCLLLSEQRLANLPTIVRLGHAPHELSSHLHQHVCGQVEVGVLQVAGDPARQLVSLVVPLVSLVSKHLQQQVLLATGGAHRVPSHGAKLCRTEGSALAFCRLLSWKQGLSKEPNSIA